MRVERPKWEALARAESVIGALAFDAADYAAVTGFAAWEWCEVRRVLASYEGKRDGDAWFLAVELHDGRVGYVEAGCDFTGWDCQSQGWSVICDAWSELVRNMSEDGRAKLLPARVIEAAKRWCDAPIADHSAAVIELRDAVRAL